ncbi:hypothetical protein [Lysobacter arvi]|uniref:Uncharacterized protein n=1 Tax=Lysobacter arvi TaxID=3038776 RepID=A0ABU1CGE6_9GAMM|nr:hypothetical protein [Lysobacter arvi]MDR0184023.1 hypothetical protein [Lysobacter arvi]
MSISSLLAAVVMAAAAQASSAGPTTANEAAAPVASETVASTDPDDKMVCRRVRTVGSNMMTRDCRTVGQRRKDAAAARDAMNQRGIDNLEMGAR